MYNNVVCLLCQEVAKVYHAALSALRNLALPGMNVYAVVCGTAGTVVSHHCLQMKQSLFCLRRVL